MVGFPRGRRALSLGGVRLTRRGWTFAASSVVAFIAAYSSGRQEILYIACLLAVLPAVAVVVVLVKRPRLVASRAHASRHPGRLDDLRQCDHAQPGTVTQPALAMA